MKNISFLPEKFRFLEVKFSIYLNRRVFVMASLIWLCMLNRLCAYAVVIIKSIKVVLGNKENIKTWISESRSPLTPLYIKSGESDGCQWQKLSGSSRKAQSAHNYRITQNYKCISEGEGHNRTVLMRRTIWISTYHSARRHLFASCIFSGPVYNQ